MSCKPQALSRNTRRGKRSPSMRSKRRERHHSSTVEQAPDWPRAPEQGRHEPQVQVRPEQQRTGRRRQQQAAQNEMLLGQLPIIYFYLSTYKLEHFDKELLSWDCLDVTETIALFVLMLLDEKCRIFILASASHDLFMMTSRIGNAYYFLLFYFLLFFKQFRIYGYFRLLPK